MLDTHNKLQYGNNQQSWTKSGVWSPRRWTPHAYLRSLSLRTLVFGGDGAEEIDRFFFNFFAKFKLIIGICCRIISNKRLC